MGASIGSGISGLAGGKSVNDALTNAALAYGVTSFVPSSMMSSGSTRPTQVCLAPMPCRGSLYSGGAGITPIRQLML